MKASNSNPVMASDQQPRRAYIAGHEAARAAAVMDCFRAYGWDIAYDWVGNFLVDADIYARDALAVVQRQAIRTTDVFVLLYDREGLSATLETGMAMGCGRRVIVAGAERDSLFFGLPNVTLVDRDSDVLLELGHRSSNGVLLPARGDGVFPGRLGCGVD